MDQMALIPNSLCMYIIFFFFSFLFLVSLFAKKRKRPALPPGPTGYPIIGHMHMMDQLTHRGLAHLGKVYGGVLYLRLGVLHMVVVTLPDTAREVLQVRDHVFSNRPATVAVQYLTYDRSDMAFAHYGPFWRQMRKLCVTRLFSRKRDESWTSVRDEVGSLIRTINSDAGQPVNIAELVFNMTQNIIFRAAFGSDLREGQGEFISILQEFSKLMGAFNIVDFLPAWLRWIDPQGFNKRLEQARGDLDRFINRIIDDHMATRKEEEHETDMVDELLKFFDEDKALGKSDAFQGAIKISRDNIKAIIMDVMFGGTETVASAVEWAMAELMHKPEELAKVQAELEDVVGTGRVVNESDLDKLCYLKCVIKETLRLHPPIPLLLHETAEDSTIGGYFVPARTRVSINVWAIGRDPSSWEDPDTFTPERFAKEEAIDFKGSHFELIPFGSGRRSCPGLQLGLHTLEFAVAQLAHCFTWSLVDGMKPSDMDMNDVFGLTAPKAQRLVAIPIPRLQCCLS